MSVYRLINIYRVREKNQDGVPSRLIGYFSSEVNADMAARGKGPWGASGEIKIVQALRITGTGEIFVLADEARNAVTLDPELAMRRADLRREGLAKLSKLERDALEIVVTDEDEEG